MTYELLPRIVLLRFHCDIENKHKNIYSASSFVEKLKSCLIITVSKAESWTKSHEMHPFSAFELHRLVTKYESFDFITFLGKLIENWRLWVYGGRVFLNSFAGNKTAYFIHACYIKNQTRILCDSFLKCTFHVTELGPLH